MKTAIKYSPTSLADVIYPNIAVERRIAGYATGQLEGHLLLWGPNGTGKTTVADLLPYAISGASACVEDKDFDEVLSKKDLKTYLSQACSFGQMTGSSKFFLIMHEFDNAKVNVSKLWTAMDKCEDELMVIITTNNPMHVHPSIRSRCDCIEFPKLTAQQVLPRAQLILKAEGVSLSNSQVLYYLKQEEVHGDLRKYFKKLDEIIFIVTNGLVLPPIPSAANQPVFTVVSNSTI